MHAFSSSPKPSLSSSSPLSPSISLTNRRNSSFPRTHFFSLQPSVAVPVKPLSLRSLQIVVLTFNCGETGLLRSELESSIPAGKDVYLFALQECRNPAGTAREIDQFLNAQNRDYLVRTESIGTALKLPGNHGTITVIAGIRANVAIDCPMLRPAGVREGIRLGICRLGNKGSAGIQLMFGHYSMLFVGSHFASDLKVELMKGSNEGKKPPQGTHRECAMYLILLFRGIFGNQRLGLFLSLSFCRNERKEWRCRSWRAISTSVSMKRTASAFWRELSEAPRRTIIRSCWRRTN